MVAMAAKGPEVSFSEEAELLACQKSIEFTVMLAFLNLSLKGIIPLS